MFGVCSSRNGGTKWIDMPGWCIESVKGKLVPGVESGGHCMPRGFWDEAPRCCALKVTCGGGLTRGLVISDGLMRG